MDKVGGCTLIHVSKAKSTFHLTFKRVDKIALFLYHLFFILYTPHEDVQLFSYM